MSGMSVYSSLVPHRQLSYSHGSTPLLPMECKFVTHYAMINDIIVLSAVVSKLVTRGYQPHLEDLLLRLNFNDFYGQHHYRQITHQ